MREFLARLFDWLRRGRLESELKEELAFHRAQLERDALAAGASPGDARRSAMRQLGNTTSVQESAWERWSIPGIEHILQDTRYALRGMRRSPGFAATVVLTLALGMGANTAMFGVIDRLMFRPFAYLRDPDQVHRVYLQASSRGERSWDWGGEYTRYLDFKRLTTAFSQHAAFAIQTMAVGTGAASREQQVGTVSASFFDFFDAPPVLGRYFTAREDTTPRGAEVAVLSHRFWQTEFASRNVVGERLQVGHIATTIIGVAPEGFDGVNSDVTAAVYIPVTLFAGSAPVRVNATTYYTAYNWSWLSTMVRRRPGVSVAQASADLTRVWRTSWELQRGLRRGMETVEQANPVARAASLLTAAGPERGLEARTALWLTGVALIVFIIACANVANLFLVRAFRRQREIALRLALGVSRARLLSQTLMESSVLCLLGAAGALAVATWGGAAIRGLLLPAQGTSASVISDPRTLAVVVIATVTAGLFTGVVPAFAFHRGDVARALKAGVREGTYQRSRLRVALLVVQATLSVVLLIGAALFVRSLNNVREIRMGYDADRVLMAERNLRGVVLDSAQRVALRRELMERARSIPGVEGVAWLNNTVPLWGSFTTDLYVPGVDSLQRLGRFTYQTATADYFRVAGTRILRGRSFTDNDRAGSQRVAIVSDAMARTLWPGRDPIGECIGIMSRACVTVVGVAEDVVLSSIQLSDARRYHYYLPLDQYGPQGGSLMMIRMGGDLAPQMEPLRKALQSLMPGQGYVTVFPFSNSVNATRRSWRLGATMFLAFGVLALIVAAVGLHGVVSYTVSQRMHELGVRVALGARRPDLLRLVLGQSARFMIAGCIAGSVLATLASRWIQPLLFQQSARDPAVYALVTGIMLIVAFAAAASPALRAARADPNQALRAE